jgi:O-antigen/teichoic acid export membrane protein
MVQHELVDTAVRKPCRHSSGSGVFQVLSGASMAIANYLLYSVAMVVLARHVFDTHTFGDFSAAIAAVTVGATAGTLGLEKYLLKFIPACRVRGDLNLVRGYRRFAPVAVLVVSILVGGMLMLIWALSEPESALHHPSFLAGIIALPIVVMGSYFLEVTTADGAYLWGTVIYRIIFPALILAGVFVVDWLHSPVVALHAVVMWGVCWAIVLVLLLIVAACTVPRSERKGQCSFQRVSWMRHSTAYLTYSLLLSMMANTGVLVLGFISSDKEKTAIYAAVAQLGALFVVISTAMNRWYGPQISSILEANDADRGQRLIRSRRLIMWGIAALYVVFIVFFGKQALSLFGTDYVEGHAALMIIGISTVITSVNSIAPIYIQYTGREWSVPVMLMIGVVLSFGFTIPGAFLWGLEGAAGGYALASGMLFISFHLYARHIRRTQLRSLGRTDLSPII